MSVDGKMSTGRFIVMMVVLVVIFIPLILWLVRLDFWDEIEGKNVPDNSEMYLHQIDSLNTVVDRLEGEIEKHRRKSIELLAAKKRLENEREIIHNLDVDPDSAFSAIKDFRFK